MKQQFKLVPDTILPHWIDVIYPNEERPRYMMNLEQQSCTCIGNSLGRECKHLKKAQSLSKRLNVIS